MLKDSRMIVDGDRYIEVIQWLRMVMREFFNCCISEQEKNELLARKYEFAKATEIELNITE